MASKNTSVCMATFLQNDSFLRTFLRQATDPITVWLMRQAGRYLSDYQATREKIKIALQSM
jgi:uroporphyrinogen decarboxylase